MSNTIKAFPIRIDPSERFSVYINGAHLQALAGKCGFRVDYALLRDTISQHTKAKKVRLNFYAVLDTTEEHNPYRRVLDWMSYNGYRVVEKEARVYTDRAGERRVRGSVDVEMACDMIDAAYNQNIDRIVLFSGEDDMGSVVDLVQRCGVNVTVVSLPTMASDNLRRAADDFVDFSELRPFIESARTEAEPIRMGAK